ncbi:DUF2267 domain-containing protein [Nafulsella turpanensis]|uniref:DUF2267 domain-containing protein n=1 Tax=Nafulsella turpanensis TaxID=1265690 RepID=UPI0003487962|nr:DUF2267 domain-containing protein [Nafulsella turpanensis]
MNHYFDEYLNDANRFVNKLSEDLGHPEDSEQTIRLVRAVLHTIRDRISIAESLDFLSQLPMILKALYVEQWTYHEQPPLHYEDLEGFADAVKNQQARLGEKDFDWPEPTIELVKKVLKNLREYISDGQAIHILEQMPEGVRELF